MLKQPTNASMCFNLFPFLVLPYSLLKLNSGFIVKYEVANNNDEKTYSTFNNFFFVKQPYGTYLFLKFPITVCHIILGRSY